MDAKTVQPALKIYLTNVKRQIRVSSAFLYGSVAEGRASATSDVDLIVLSDDFAKLDPDERARLLYRASVGFPYDLHVYGLTPKEFNDASPLTSLGQVKTAKRILLD